MDYDQLNYTKEKISILIKLEHMECWNMFSRSYIVRSVREM